MSQEQSLDFSGFPPRWAKRFTQIHAAKPLKSGPFPKFENPKAIGFFTRFNLWAFFLSALYYFIKGMWRKGLVLIGINVLLLIGLSLINPALGNLASVFAGVLAASMAGFDYYRKEVLHETFWF